MIFNSESELLVEAKQELAQEVLSKPLDPDSFEYRNNFTIEKPIDDDYETLDIKDSARLLSRFDTAIKNGTCTLYKWQVEVNEDLCYGRVRVKGEVTKTYRPDQLHPYKYPLVAANGSGKDAFVIAPFALWFILTKIKAKVIITSASGAQLTTQTEHYISTLATEINKWSSKILGYDILKVRKRHVYCTKSGSVIHMFATDEGEKAEGHHPTAPGCEMAIIVNEAKSVTKDIFDALNRCTGYNYWVNISSPGVPQGDFFRSTEKWPTYRRVTVFDCPDHQSLDLLQEDIEEYGEHSAYVRSKWLALFTFIDGKFVISHDKLNELRKRNKLKLIQEIRQTDPIKIGIDISLSTNGDESVISPWLGNKQLAQKTYRSKDAILLAEMFNRDLRIWVDKKHQYIWADDGGVGRAVITILERMGWRINRVLNQSRHNVQKRLYKNKGAQTWWKVGRLIEEFLLILLDDDKLYNQLASRKYKESKSDGTDVLTLESKADMILQGFNSPDRADGMVLAFTDTDVRKFLDIRDEATKPKEIPITPEDMIQHIKAAMRRHRSYSFGEGPDIKQKSYGSLNAIMRRDRMLTYDPK